MIFGEHDDKTRAQMAAVAETAVQWALMADGHFGYVMPIGGVAGYRNQVCPVHVGFDIACGNMAAQTDRTLESLGLPATPAELDSDARAIRECPELVSLADEIVRDLAFGVGKNNESKGAPRDHEVFDRPEWAIVPERGGIRASLSDKARNQLGTIGSGNHYVDVLADEDGKLWVGTHFGSRGFGHTIASTFLAISQGGDWGDRGDEIEVLLDLGTNVGDDYWALMNLAGDYAYAGREWVTRRVAGWLGTIKTEVHNHHNFAWKEDHGDEELIVVRKGATPARPGQKGFVGGSMGDDAVILRGSETSEGSRDEIRTLQRQAMYSTVHGAGRVMGRMEAKGKIKKGRVVREGKISQEQMDTWLDNRGVILRGGGRDEAPQAYRRLPDVLSAQGETIEVLHTLRPLIVCMAGDERRR